MKFLLIFLGSCCFQVCIAQVMRPGYPEIYGNRTISSATIFAALNLNKGDSFHIEKMKKEDIVARLKQIPAVKQVSAGAVCCDVNGNTILYVGIGESDSVILKHRPPPVQNMQLPDSIMNIYESFSDKLSAGIRKGENTEDDSNGYALFNYAPARSEQNKLIQYASSNLPVLVRVMQNSKNARQRAAAVTMIAYTTEKKKIANYLLYAVDDADDEVRNNATRALGILADYAQSHKDIKINIPAGPFIKMMNSIVWTDRNKGATVLMRLCESRDQKLLDEIKEKALPSIIEMAKWKDRGHAFFSFMILGHMAGMDPDSLAGKNFSPDYSKEIDMMTEKIFKKEKGERY